MGLIIIFGLILLNGFLSMSEIALVSARKSKLELDLKKGSKRAKCALDLSKEPDRFLPTVQIGITLVGILIGLFSGENFPYKIELYLNNLGVSPNLSNSISVISVVVIVTFISLVFGELVPKRIGMTFPETISKIVSSPMLMFSKIASPFVWLLSSSTNLIIKAFHLDFKSSNNKITEEEIKAIIQEGTNDGEIQEVEQDIVERVFHLGDRDVSSLMTHRNDIDWLDISQDSTTLINYIKEHIHSVYPVADNQIDNIKGVIFLKEIFNSVHQSPFDIKGLIHPAQYVPLSMDAYDALELFKNTKIHHALVSDEFGNFQGIVTMFDIMNALVGDISTNDEDEYKIVQHADGNWLVDGQYSFFDFLTYFDIDELYPEYDYNTLSGLILDILKKIPQEGDTITWKQFNFEIIDMDGARIDKVLISKKEEDK